MTPLEQYAFGDDQGFKYPGEKGTGKESYLVRSRELPEQTTILGLLRYLVLQDQKMLKTDFQYTEEERARMKQYIGAESFSFSSNELQNFGYIHEISPVFLVNDKEEILIRNPFHNKAKSGYSPIQMEEGTTDTSAGNIALPKIGEYSAKDGYASGYYNLATGEIENNLFQTNLVSGNRKNAPTDSDEDGYFKRELKLLKKGYSFAVFADVEKLPENAIGYMGKKKCAFSIEMKKVDDIDHLWFPVKSPSFLQETKKVDDIDLVGMVRELFKENDDTWYYALSDIVIDKNTSYDNFCIVEEKHQRNLETVYSETSHLKKLRKSEIRYNLIQSGSVFYKSCNLELNNKNCEQIGYNKIVQLGGK